MGDDCDDDDDDDDCDDDDDDDDDDDIVDGHDDDDCDDDDDDCGDDDDDDHDDGDGDDDCADDYDDDCDDDGDDDDYDDDMVMMMMMTFYSTSAFPCWDEPAVKATFSVTIIIPAHLTAISNMPELSVIHLPPTTSPSTAVKDPSAKVIALKKVVFDTSPKMSTYLLAWAIGEFDFVQGTTKSGVSIRVITPPGRGMQGKFALDVGIRSLEFYDDFFKVCMCVYVCMYV